MFQSVLLPSAVLGAAAWSLTGPLMRSGMLLEGWAKVLDRLNNAGHGWLAKPLGWCGKCFAGQLGLWYSITTCQAFHFWDAGLTATTSIFFFILIEKWQSSND